MQDFPFAVDRQASLAAFLDQLKGARLELRLGSDTVAGTIIGARTVKPDDKTPERENVVLLTDSGEIRTFDMGAASSVKLSDPKLQGLHSFALERPFQQVLIFYRDDGVTLQARASDARSARSAHPSDRAITVLS